MRHLVSFKFWLWGVALAGVLLFAPPAAVAQQSAELRGPARALNGHTLEIDGVTIKLLGIRAPDPGHICTTPKGQQQQCGRLSLMALAQMLRAPEVHCVIKVPAVAQEMAAGECFVGWMNVSEEMVAGGWAIVEPVSGQAFERAQTFAKARREGLWRNGPDQSWFQGGPVD